MKKEIKSTWILSRKQFYKWSGNVLNLLFSIFALSFVIYTKLSSITSISVLQTEIIAYTGKYGKE